MFPYTNSCWRLAVYIINRKRVLIGKHKPNSIDNNSFIPEKEKPDNNVCVVSMRARVWFLVLRISDLLIPGHTIYLKQRYVTIEWIIKTYAPRFCNFLIVWQQNAFELINNWLWINAYKTNKCKRFRWMKHCTICFIKESRNTCLYWLRITQELITNCCWNLSFIKSGW